MRNRVFFPQTALDSWISDDRVELTAEELAIAAEGRRYRIVEAVRVVREVTGSPDQAELVGKVKSRAFLSELGAELLEGSMILGDNAYDVVPGFVGAPIGTLAEHRSKSDQAPSAEKKPLTDEELLAAFLAEKL